MSIQSSPLDLIKDLRNVRSAVLAKPLADSWEATPGQLQPLSLELALRLQTSLEVEWVIDQFMKLIHSQFMYDGYSYRLEQPALAINMGREKGHQCAYNLSIENFELGKLTLYRGRKYAESELVLLENLMTSLMHPLRNAIMYRNATQLAHRDVLTGVHNRATFDTTVTREINLAQRNKTSLAMLVVDIDHFKRVNDTWGHATGDDVIKVVAQMIQQSVRNTDHVFRYGGEEFVVVLEAADCEIACVIADRILDAVRHANVVVQGQKLNLAVSIGLSCLKRCDTAKELFGRADRALYEAKKTGRDQYQVA